MLVNLSQKNTGSPPCVVGPFTASARNSPAIWKSVTWMDKKTGEEIWAEITCDLRDKSEDLFKSSKKRNTVLHVVLLHLSIIAPVWWRSLRPQVHTAADGFTGVTFRVRILFEVWCPQNDNIHGTIWTKCPRKSILNLWHRDYFFFCSFLHCANDQETNSKRNCWGSSMSLT